MPELPEIESLRRYLVREGVVVRVIERVDVESKPSPEKGTGGDLRDRQDSGAYDQEP